jgi:hypothetical protein
MKGRDMIVDEMELVGRLGDVEPLPDEVLEQARTLLQAAIAVEGERQVTKLAHHPKLSHHPKRRHRAAVVRSGVAAGVAAAAAVAVIALVASSPGPSTAVPSASHHAATSPGQSTTAPSASHHAPTSLGQSTTAPSVSNPVASPLLRLASYVSATATPPGDASLVVRTTGTGGNSVTVYDLYADNGQYFFSQTESGLAAQVSEGNDLGGGIFAREIAAANLAVTGNVQTAAQDMADAPDPSNVISPTQTADPSAIAAKEKATGVPQVGSLFDNWVWENSQDALIAGSSQPQVRAGVLKILATLPDVTVTSSTSAGQPTLVLTAGADEVGANYSEQLTINATTGIPVSFASGVPGQTPSGTITYQVSRVALSDIAAGKY